MAEEMLRKVLGTACFVLTGVMATASVALLFGEANPRSDALLPLFLSGLFGVAGAVALNGAARPIYGEGRARQMVSTLLLFAAAVAGISFVALVSEENSGASGDSAALLFLTLVLVGSGLALRGTRSFGSFRGNLALLGIGAVVVPLLILLFVFSNSVDVDVGPAPSDPTDEVIVDERLPGEVLLATALLMLLGAVGVWFWARRAVAPMAEITHVANEIQAGSLDQRIGLRHGASEVRQLADSFDRMLDRLARSSSAQQRLIEDASHELRTPLAALAVNNEVVLNAANPTVDDYREAAERGQALIDRLQATIDELLLQGRTSNQQLQQVDNDLMAIVGRVADQHRVLNPEIPIAVRGPGQLLLGIDGPSVQRALVNLVQNAARYSPAGLPIEIDVTSTDDAAHLSVTDHGPGIPPEERDAIFERYYQSDGTDGGSAGIGLNLVKQVAEAHGAIHLTSPMSASGGTRFTLTFR